MAIEDNIQVSFTDLSVRFSTEVGTRGFTVINAPKGTTKPIFFSAKSESLIRSVYGDYSDTYPHIWEAIQYNKKYGIYISAPSVNGLYGGVYVTKDGTLPIDNGIADPDSIDLSAIVVTEQIGIGDGANDTFSFTTTKFDYYVNQSVDVLVDGTSISVVASDAEPEVLTSASLTSGTYTRATGALAIVFDPGSIPATNEVVSVQYTIDLSNDCYFVLLNSAPQADDKACLITQEDEIFTTTLYSKNTDGTYKTITGYPKQLSISRSVKGDYGANIFVDDVFLDDKYFMVVRNTDITTVDTFTDDTAKVDFAGGDRGDTLTASNIASGYDYAKDINTYPVNILFDCTGGSDIITKFVDLRTNYNKYASYIYPLSNTTEGAVVTEKQGYSLDERGLMGYWSWALIDNPLNDSFFISNLLGAIASKYADMSIAYNGLQPAGLDENDLGGLLSGLGIKEMYSKPVDITTMKKNRINYLTFSVNWGLYIETALTSLVATSDYTSVGHSRLADYIVKVISEQILPLQYEKLNDASHRAKIKSLCDSLLNPMISQPYPVLRDFLVKCDEENNNDEVLAREEFVLDVVVKFTPFAKVLKLSFINTSQNTEVSEVFE